LEEQRKNIMTEGLANPAFQQKLTRFYDAVSLRGPDRIPVIPIGMQFFDSQQAGLTKKQAMNDHQERYRIWKSFILEYNFDMAPALGTFPAQVLETMGAKHYLWPGGGLSDNLPFQYVEREYLLQDEYDQLLINPGDFTCRVIWPRKSASLEPAADLPSLHRLGMDPSLLGAYLADTQLRTKLEMLITLGEQYQEWLEIQSQAVRNVEEEGFPLTYGTPYGHTAFDVLADYYRGLRGIMLDMFQVPDKLLAALDLFTEMMIEWMIEDARNYDNPRVPIWLHRGQDSLMSPEQYQRFYWPGLLKLTLALVEAGLTPILFFQGDNSSRLPYLGDLPRGKVPLHFDIIDRQKACKYIRDKQCFWGNVSSSLLVTGNPDQVLRDVLELIDLFGNSGGLIIDCASGIPDEAKPENLIAMRDAVHEYGQR
jgi:hypothetical protein